MKNVNTNTTITSIPTARDYPERLLDAHEKTFISRIREHGWTATYVVGEEESGKPNFFYTAGFWLLGFPELIIFSMELDTAHRLAWQIYENVRAGEAPEFGGVNLTLLEDAWVSFTPFNGLERGEHMTWTSWFYQRKPFEAVRIIWGDMAAAVPTESGFNARAN